MLRKPVLIGSFARLSAIWLVYLKPALVKRVVLFIENPSTSDDNGSDIVAYYGYICTAMLVSS